ncbi:unnamed protein product [Alternaria alternata]
MERDYSGPTGDDVDPDTDLSYADPFADEDDKDGAYLSPDNDHPPEYYIQQLETFNEEEYVKEDYKKSSTRLLNYMEDQWNQKLTKKHGLKKIGRDKACMYVEDLAQVLQTNLVTTEKRYPHGRYRIQAQLYLQLGGFTANRPQALLSLCYRHIKVTLLRDPEGGPHRVLLEFTFEFTKEFLGVKDFEAMQNLMMGHASISTFLKHYLSRRITVDTQAVVRGIQPQTAFMRAACTMSRSIDLRRPRRLTQEQSASVDEDASVRFLLDRRDRLKRKVPNATKHPEYKTLVLKISQERQRRRHALLKAVKERWEFEQPVRDVERQLAGLDAIDDSEPIHNIMLPAQEELANSILSKPGTTIEEETDRRNGAIRAVTLYCGIEEGGMYPVQKAGRSRNIALSTKSQLRYDEEALEAAKVSVYKEERPKICFLCLGNETLPLAQRIHSFSTPGDLTKHFGRKHLRNIKSSEGLSCNLCKVFLADKKHLQQHAEKVHGTASPRSSYDCC